jgi:hypothetical protein
VKPRKINHQGLLKDPLVGPWYDESALRSKLTARVNLRRLGLLLHQLDLPSSEMLSLAKQQPELLRSKFVDYAKRMLAEGRVGAYVAKMFSAPRSWFAYHRIPFDGFPKLKVIQGETIREERVPTPQELRRIVGLYTPRARVVALMMAHAAVRPGVLANIDGTDGLTLGDVKDLRLTPTVEFAKAPFHVVVPARLSKNGHEYHTFGTEELAEAILAYLGERSARGEKLTAKSPLITVEPMGARTRFRAGSGTGFITTPKMMETLRKGLWSVLKARTYIFRSYASTQLWVASNHGKITRDGVEAMMGHNLGVAGRYNLGKKLHPSLIEELREACARCAPYLTTTPSNSESATQAKIAKVMLMGLGYTEEELSSVDFDSLDMATFQELVTKKVPPAGSPARQRLVDAEELPRYLEEGWTVVTAVNGHQVVLNPPGSR